MKKDYIAILRSISIIFVVCFHIYGFMYADHFPETKHLYDDTYFWWNQCVIINVAMPLFTFISGYLFQYLFQEKNKYREFIPFVKNKFQRLWLPFFVFGIIMMATTGNFHPIRLLKGGYWHLWYLPRLFWCFVIAWCLNRWVTHKAVRLILLPIFVFFPLLGWHIPTFVGIQGVSNWFGWFYMGMVVAENQEMISNYMRKYYLCLPLFVAYIFTTIFYPIEYGERTWYFLLSTTSMLLALWYAFSNMSPICIEYLRPLVSLSKYSFGIYIFHNWIGLYLVGRFSQNLFHLPDFTHHVYLFPLGLTIVDFAISLALSWLFLKTKFGKFLIG